MFDCEDDRDTRSVGYYSAVGRTTVTTNAVDEWRLELKRMMFGEEKGRAVYALRTPVPEVSNSTSTVPP